MHMFYQTPRERCYAPFWSIHLPTQQFWNSGACDEGENLSNCMSEITQTRLTHCNPVNFRVIHFVVISIEGSLSNCKCSTNWDQIFCVLGCSCKMGVDVVHGGYHCADAWCIARKKESRILEDLRKQNSLAACYLADYIPLRYHIGFIQTSTPHPAVHTYRDWDHGWM